MADPKLRVMTYNIRHGRGVDGVVDLGRIAAVVEEAAPDVVALQEVDCGRPRSRAIDQAAELARRLGMEPHFAACVIDGAEQYGIATLSRLPVKRMSRLALPGHERSEPRAALRTAVDWPGGPVEVVNTHLSTRRGERPRQVAELLAAFAAAPDDDLVLGGDLNMLPRSSGFRRLLQSLREVAARGRSWPARLPLIRLDHLLYRGGLTASEGTVVDTPLARRASDHLPVIASFRRRP